MIQFKYPELLWALGLLIIPILIHLFHLRKFKKTPFTNVALLKTIKISTRKSSQLKKWLVLITRLLMLAFLILAFAQPFLPNSENFNKSSELVIYLDNSFSMQAKGTNGSLLNDAKQQLLNYLPDEGSFSLFTNNQTFAQVSKATLTRDLINLGYSTNQYSYEAAYLKALQLFDTDQSSLKNLIFISDFQQTSDNFQISKDSLVNFGSIQLRPQNRTNASIDSVYVLPNSSTKDIYVKLSNFGTARDNMTVSLYSEKQLITKVSTALEKEATVQFSLSETDGFKGRFEISDNSLSYDNQFYFNLPMNEKIQVLSINGSEDTFLRKIYTADEFIYKSFDADAIDYSQIATQNLVVLNHLNKLPEVLLNTLVDFHSKGGSLLVIPSKDQNLDNINQLLQRVNAPVFTEFMESSKKITQINFEHPLLANAFYAKVANFQYPEVQTFFKRSNKRHGVYQLEDGNDFLTGYNRVFSFSADLSESNSNFLQSPLIVPALYNMGKQSLSPSELYYPIGLENTIVLKEALENDAVLYLKGSAYSGIPRQRIYGNYIEVTTNEEPKEEGPYTLTLGDQTLKHLSYNYSRDESNLNYWNMESMGGLETWDSIADAISDIKTATKVKLLWKWFAIFALVFLLLEMLILKYFK